MGISKRFCMMPIAIGLAQLHCATVFAADKSSQSTAVSGSPTGIEEVIITARKTEESAQVVPLAVKALAAADLEKQAILSVSDLRSSVPGLFISPNSQGGAPTFAIRAAKADNGTSDTVTAYIGDVPVASTRSIANMMYDMQSISVLKGPQGTLFGANSTGGAIIFRPNMPGDKFEGYVDIGVGNYNRSSIQGMINWPISDNVQIRIAAEGIDRDKGFYHNIPSAPVSGIYGTGYNGIREIGTDKHESARITLRIKPSREFQNDFEYDYFHQNDTLSSINNYPVALRSPYNYQTFLGFPLLVNYGASGMTAPTGNGIRLDALPIWNKAKIDNYIDTATYELSNLASVKAVFGYQKLDLDTSESSNTPNVAVHGRTLHHIDKWTFEPSLDLKSEDGRMRDKMGIFLSGTKIGTGNAYTVVGLPWDQTAPQNNFPVAGLPAWQFANLFYPLDSNNYYRREFKSHAIYNQFSFDLTKELTATLGLRYSWDTGTYWATSHLGFPTTSGFQSAYGNFYFGNCSAGSLSAYPGYSASGCYATANYKSQAPSFTFTLEDKYADQSMIYATLRGGYLLGGFNNAAAPSVTGIPINFEPEKVVDFETGLKSDWELWGRPVRTNLAVFYGNYKNQQRVQNGTTPTGTTFIGVVNAGASSFYGLDFDGTYEVSDNLELTASWNHIETEYTKFNAIVNVPGVFAYVDLAGQPMSQTPKDQFSLGATAKWPLSSNLGILKSTLTYSWTDKTASRDSPTFACAPNAAGQCFGPTSSAVDFRQYDQLGAYDLFNFTTAWKNVMGSNFDANFWIKNLLDKKYIVATSNQLLQFGYATATRGDPRTFGLNVRYNF